MDYKTMLKEFLEFIGWDTKTTIPSEGALKKLGMDFLIDDMKKVNVPAAA